MNQYLKSYSSLRLLEKYFELVDLHSTTHRISATDNREATESIFRAISGLFILGRFDLEAIDEFITNRYFQDSLAIDSLPSTAHTRRFFEENISIIHAVASDCLESIGKKFGYFENIENKYKDSIDLYGQEFQKVCKEKNEHKNTLQIIFQFTTYCLIDITKSGATGELVQSNSLFTKEVKDKLENDGYAIIEGALPIEEVNYIRELTLKVANAERTNGTAYVYGGNDKCQRIYNLLNKHQTFRNLIQRPLVLEIMEHMFNRNTMHDKFVLSSWHTNIIGPGGKASILHVDAAVPEPLPQWIVRANINFMLDDFTEENGATLCLPGSHKFFRKPQKADQIRTDLKSITGPKGSLAIWNGHLWHRSGANNTNNDRIALLGCFAASHLREMCLEENHLEIIDRDIINGLTPLLQRLIGFDHGIKTGSKQRHSGYEQY